MLSLLASTPLGLRAGPPMMRTGLKVVGNNVQVTDALKDAAESKLGKALDRYEPLLMSTTLHFKVRPECAADHTLAIH